MMRGLLAMLALSGTGCAAHWCQLPDDFAYAFGQTQLGWELHDICHGLPLGSCSCSAEVSGQEVCGSCDGHRFDCVNCLETCRAKRRHPRRIKVGPPPESYKPPMPPTFLPVPASPVF